LLILLNIPERIRMRNLMMIWLLLAVPFISLAQPTGKSQQEVNPDGYNKFYYDNGKISSEGTMHNGKPDGYWKTYYPSGKLKSEGNRKSSQLDSLWKFYNEEGKITVEFNYSQGKKNGLKKTYDPKEGFLVQQETFAADVKQGPTNIFYTSGKVKQVIPFDKGLENGIGYEYAEDGTIITVIDYRQGYVKKQEKINRRDKNNQKQGNWKDFYANGNIKWEGKFTNDKKDGYFKEYSEKGDLLATTKFVDGKQQKDAPELAKIEVKREYYETGVVKYTGGFREDGTPEGLHKEFSPKGEVINSRIFKDGAVVAEGVMDSKNLEQGIWKEYHTNGQLKSQGEYKDGKKVGEWVFYHPNGKVEQKGKYDKKGRAQGEWKWYYESGNILREEVYVDDQLEGPMTEYAEDSKVITKGEYLEGLKEGAWVYEMGDYREEGKYTADKRVGMWKHFYTSDNQLRFEGNFVDGNPDGKHEYYWPSGKTREKGKYIVGRKECDWEYYNEDGSLQLTITYKDDQEIKFDGVKVRPILDANANIIE
jgi:antitoxin component YwqK of YwqJK toxin-antitoxin module